MTMREQRDDRDQWLDHLGALALPGSAGAGPCMEPASILGGKFVRPHLRAVEHAQDANSIGVDQIGRDIGRARNDQLARAKRSVRQHEPLHAELSASIWLKISSRSDNAKRDQTCFTVCAPPPREARRHGAARNALRPRNHRDRGGYPPVPGAPSHETSYRKPGCCSRARAEASLRWPCASAGSARRGYRETHVFQNRGGLFLHVRIDAGLDEGIGSHRDLLRSPLM